MDSHRLMVRRSIAESSARVCAWLTDRLDQEFMVLRQPQAVSISQFSVGPERAEQATLLPRHCQGPPTPCRCPIPSPCLDQSQRGPRCTPPPCAWSSPVASWPSAAPGRTTIPCGARPTRISGRAAYRAPACLSEPRVAYRLPSPGRSDWGGQARNI
jgi:hypothetical protein